MQRPESVVKELVENSLDSGADTIAVFVKNAGKSLIHIVDNGSGMEKEDLQLSIQRHATSKIIKQEDLEKIITYGFRGEALASISSVANLEIRTRTKSNDLGWQLLSEPMKQVTINPTNTELGTQIFVRNLFYNVPARRKFLRANLTEFRYISDTMIKFALSNPDVRFTFYDNDNLIFDVHPQNLKERVIKLLGKSQTDDMMEVNYENEYFNIHGFVGMPSSARQSKSGQYLFMNKRAINSKSISHAVFSAYEQLLEKNQQPVFVLNMQIDPEKVDVNVHPQKNEVKFEDERFIYNSFRRAVKETLVKHNLTPSISLDMDTVSNPFQRITTNQGEDLLVNKATGEFVQNNPQQSNRSTFREFDNQQDYSKPRPTEQEMSAFDMLFGDKGDFDKNMPEQNQGNERRYWQLHNKYILSHTKDGLLIIDQHNAHERILYEKAVKAMNKEFTYSQQTLFPVKLEMSNSQINRVKELQDELLGLGYEFTYENENTIIITALPMDIKAGDEQDSLLEIVDLYEEYSRILHTNKRDNLAASYSCKSAIKTGQKLSQEEMKSLADQLEKCELPYVCPHGREVIVEIKVRELDNKFGRSQDPRFAF